MWFSVVRVGPERVQRGDQRAWRRTVRVSERLTPGRHVKRGANGVGQHLVELGRQSREGIGDEPSLHLRRYRLDPFVDRHDPPAVDRLDVVLLDDLELWIRDLQAGQVCD